MKLFLRITLAAILLSSTLAAAQSLEEMKALWRDKQWQKVVPELLAFRNQPGGRTWEVDYMIGTGECHLQGKEKQGEAVLNYVLENYHLPDKARDATTKAIEYCESHATATQEEPPFFYVPISGQVANGPMVAGKGGYTFASRTKVTSITAPPTPTSITELQKRVYSSGEEQQALKAAQARVANGTVQVKDGFVVVCSGYCEVPPAEVAECLGQYRNALQEFKMQTPKPLITVYLTGRVEEVSELAEKLHGISLPLGTVAYSVYDDLSMVGMAAYAGSGIGCGSLGHEMVHLSIRSSFGDSPPWLEEGLASEVAVSQVRGNRFAFGSSWRDQILQDVWELRPKVAQLLAANWTDYSADTQEAVSRVAALHAMAAVFIRYLDAKDKLVPVYFAMRDERFPAGAEAPRSDASIVEEELGMSTADVDADFVKWFKTRPATDEAGTNAPASNRGNSPEQVGPGALNTASPRATQPEVMNQTNAPAHVAPNTVRTPNAPAEPSKQ